MKKIIPLIAIITACSCSKVKEVPEPAGKPIVDVGRGPLSLKGILDSVPDITIYKTAWQKSKVQRYMDSVRNAVGKTDVPFTLFVPRDAAWQKAGYTLSQVQGLSAEACDQLLMYLTISGNILPQHAMYATGGSSFFPVIPPDKFPHEENGTIYYTNHFYSLNLAWTQNAVFLNGSKIGAGKDIVPALDGAVYLADTLIRKPTHTVYELLAADTSYSFYLAALAKSNLLYQQYKAGISPGDRNEELLGVVADPFANYLQTLKTFTPNERGQNRFSLSFIVFAPDNNAFRKAGMTDIAAIEQYLEQSYITTPAYRDMDHAIPMYTNLDSVLRYSFHTPIMRNGSGFGIAFVLEHFINNVSGGLLYTTDLQENDLLHEEGLSWREKLEFCDWTSFDENIFDFSVIVRRESTNRLKFLPADNRITLKRGDRPGGRAAYIVPEHSNITALNGVIHRIDNLLLPTP